MSALLAQARLTACRYWPFASHAILSMVPVPRPGLGTLAVDQHWRLYYDEAALQRMGVEQSAGLVLHELDHLLKRHHKRAQGFVGDDDTRWDTWNHATDAAINGDLRAQDIPLPPGLVYPEKFRLPAGLSAEEYAARCRISPPLTTSSKASHRGTAASPRTTGTRQPANRRRTLTNPTKPKPARSRAMKATAKLRRKIMQPTWTVREMSRAKEELRMRVLRLTRQLIQERQLRLARMDSPTCPETLRPKR
jgi:hypothetical protein